MSTENDERYTPEEESYDPEGIAELRRQEEEERLNRRIRREIIRIESGESDEAIEEERQRMEEERKATEERKARRSRSILFNIFTGGFLSTDGATKYYRMLIAIAAMCFICIFLTFLSLNADREYRLLEKHAVVLRERAIIFEDRKYSISTREEVNRLMEKQGIELKDLDNDSHVIR